MDNLREKLCQNADLNLDAWKARAERGVSAIADSLMIQAGNHEVGDGYIQFTSETQAEYVRAHLAKECLVTRLFPNADRTIGLYVRWSGSPSGEENWTGTIAFAVNESWRLNEIDHAAGLAALATLGELEAAVRVDRFKAANL